MVVLFLYKYLLQPFTKVINSPSLRYLSINTYDSFIVIVHEIMLSNRPIS